MGYRMHVRTKSHISYMEDAFFNHFSEEVFQLFNEHMLIYCNEAENCWEIPREYFKSFHDKLREMLKECPNKVLIGTEEDGYTVSQVYQIMSNILDSTKNRKNFDFPDTIIIDWF